MFTNSSKLAGSGPPLLPKSAAAATVANKSNSATARPRKATLTAFAPEEACMRAAHRAALDDINVIFADVKAGKADGGSQIDRSVRIEGARLRAHPIRTLLQ
jgi:hypothetical protein